MVDNYLHSYDRIQIQVLWNDIMGFTANINKHFPNGFFDDQDFKSIQCPVLIFHGEDVSINV